MTHNDISEIKNRIVALEVETADLIEQSKNSVSKKSVIKTIGATAIVSSLVTAFSVAILTDNNTENKKHLLS